MDVGDSHVSTISDAAATAYEQAQTIAEAAEQAARDELIVGARDAIMALPAPDDTTPLAGKLKDDGKSPAVHVDLTARLAIIDDGVVAVSVRRLDDGGHELRLVELVDGAWTVRSKSLATLAELGAAFEAWSTQ